MYMIKFAGGQPSVECESLAECAAAISRKYPSAVYCDDGDTGPEPVEREIEDAGRILVWENDADSVNDSGQNAVASIRRVE